MLWTRRRSVLDMWLMVVMCGWVIEICLVSFPIAPIRYTIGWHVGRMFGLLSGSLVLISLLHEITTLYARLLRAVSAQARERETRLMTGDVVAATIAHEVKQPLSAMITNADAGFFWLDRSTPDVDQAKSTFKQIVDDGHRATAVIGSIRANFKTGALNRTSLDINDVIGEVLALLRLELQKHRILVRAEPNEQLPQVIGDRIQLQQVLLNLITNAIDSMTTKDGPRVLCVRSEVHDGRGVKVSVADTGAGIGAQDIDRLFDPLFTTKSHGMGMGLSICRSIIEAHDGHVWAAPNKPQGAVASAAAVTASSSRCRLVSPAHRTQSRYAALWMERCLRSPRMRNAAGTASRHTNRGPQVPHAVPEENSRRSGPDPWGFVWGTETDRGRARGGRAGG
jgi:signal transduction histidine kinase